MIVAASLSLALLQRPPCQPTRLQGLPQHQHQAGVHDRAGAVVMLGGRGPPKEIAKQLAPDPNDPRSKAEGGWTVNDVNKMWAAFESVYGSRERAEVAAKRNVKVLLPFLNTPETIRGAYATLVDMLGKEEAAQIIEKNPGVLSCAPDDLAQAAVHLYARWQRIRPPACLLRAARTCGAGQLAQAHAPYARGTHAWAWRALRTAYSGTAGQHGRRLHPLRRELCLVCRHGTDRRPSALRPAQVGPLPAAHRLRRLPRPVVRRRRLRRS